MRKTVIAGNWKMHMNCADTEKFLLKFLPLIKDIGIERNIVIAPPFTAISTFSKQNVLTFFPNYFMTTGIV